MILKLSNILFFVIRVKWFGHLQMKLYDHRLMHRGAVQSYEGNVNSHSRIELGVDPSEKVVMSGEHGLDWFKHSSFFVRKPILSVSVCGCQVGRTAISVSGISSRVNCSSGINSWVLFRRLCAGQKVEVLLEWDCFHQTMSLLLGSVNSLIIGIYANN